MSLPRILLKWFLRILILLLIGLLPWGVFQRKSLLEWGVSHYFSTKNIKASVEVHQWTWTELKLKNLTLEAGLDVSLVHLKWEKPWWRSPLPENIDIDIKNISLHKLLNTLQNLQSSPQTSTALSPQQLKNFCAWGKSVNLNVRLQEMRTSEKSSLMSGQLTSEKGEGELSVQADTQQGINSFATADGSWKVDCDKDLLWGRLESWHVEVKNLFVSDLVIESLLLKIPEAQANYSADKGIESDGQLSLKAQIKMSEGSYKIAETPLIWHASSDLKKEWAAALESEHFEVQQPLDLKMQNLQVEIKSKDLVSGRFSVQQFSLPKIAPDFVHLHGLKSQGTFETNFKKSSVHFSVTDATGSLHLKDLRATYQAEPKKIELHFPEKKSLIHVQEETFVLFPVLKKYIQRAQGKILISGQVINEKDQWVGPLQLRGVDLNLVSSAGEIRDLDLFHDILSLETFESSPKPNLQVHEIVSGNHNIHLKAKYHLKSLNNLFVDRLDLYYDEIEVQAQNFRVDPLGQEIDGFRAQIKNWSLEKLLALALQKTVSAKGVLAGEISLSYKNHRPRLSGHFSTQGPGWIRYRTGYTPRALLSPSDGPMDILNSYLYDFNYEDLSVDISTDENFKMIVTLKAYGRNPHYLKGKPLKLNVNLEQNLLAALRSVMLTSNLPDQLKDFFEKAKK